VGSWVRIPREKIFLIPELTAPMASWNEFEE
jgi:hypothetical protein